MASKSTGTGEGDGSAGVRGLSDTAKARGGKTIGKPKTGAAAAMAGAGRGPGGSGKGVHPRSAAKMLGGGLAAGSTDFGPGNAGASGGRAGSRGNATRTSGIGGTMPTGGGGAVSGGLNSGGEGVTGAFGNTVLATGRRTRDDSRQAIGSADRADADDTLTARGNTQAAKSSSKRSSNASKVAGSRRRTSGSRPGHDTARGGGQTGDVTASPETLGSNAIAASTGSTPSGSRVRPGEITNDGGRGVRNDAGPNFAPARGGSADVETSTGDARGGWKRAAKSAREGRPARGKQTNR